MRMLLPLVMLVAQPALASTPAAWTASARAGANACLKASGLRQATVPPSRVGFPDTVGCDAMLVHGIWPQRHMKGAKGTMLCLYHRTTKRAVVEEAKGWLAR